MPIADTDIVYRLTIPGAAAGDADAQPDPNDSLGDYVSTTVYDKAGNLHELFDVVTGTENAASTVDYRCIAVVNKHATLTLQDAALFISGETSGGADIAIGLDPVGVVPLDDTTAQAASPVDENTAPAGVSFSAPTTFATGLAIGDIAPDETQCFWLRRTALAGAAVDADDVSWTVQGDTAA